MEGVWREPAFLAGALTCFVIRAAAIQRGWSLPGYRPRPGRDYPDGER